MTVQVLTTIAHYPTNVTMCIVSNRPELLQQAIKGWAVGADQWVCGTDEVLSNPLHLAFVHRTYMERAFTVPGKPCCTKPLVDSILQRA